MRLGIRMELWWTLNGAFGPPALYNIVEKRQSQSALFLSMHCFVLSVIEIWLGWALGR